jgi:hypothetical protein
MGDEEVSMNARIAGALGAALVVGTIAQALALRDTRREVEELRSTIDRLQTRQAESSTRSGEALAEVRDDVARVEKKVAQAAAAPPPAQAPAAKPGALPTYLTEEDIQKVVDERVEKLQAKGDAPKGGGNDGDRKMPLHDLARELALDPKIETQVADIANAAKKDIFDILRTPRPDGTSVADELIDILTKGDQAGAQKLFQRLFTEEIPGTQTTYLAGVGAVQDRARGLLQTAMGPDAFQQFQHMNVHPENIQTGYDPMADYFKSRSRK